MNRIFNRVENEEVFTVNEKLRIGVIGLSDGAGSTLIASSLALMHAKNRKKSVAFVDVSGHYACKYAMPISLTYDALGMEQRFAMREFADVFGLADEGKNIRKISNIDEHINWILEPPASVRTGEKANLSQKPGSENNAAASLQSLLYKCLRVINNAAGDVVVCDIGTAFAGNELEVILAEMDEVYVVVDPLPSKLLGGSERLAELRKLEVRRNAEGRSLPFGAAGAGNCFHYIVNKMNGGVPRRDLKDFLRVKNFAEIGVIASDELYAAEFACRIPASNKRIWAALEPALGAALER